MCIFEKFSRLHILDFKIFKRIFGFLFARVSIWYIIYLYVTKLTVRKTSYIAYYFLLYGITFIF